MKKFLPLLLILITFILDTEIAFSQGEKKLNKYKAGPQKKWSNWEHSRYYNWREKVLSRQVSNVNSNQILR